MASTSDNQPSFFDRDNLRDIGMGVGAGLQAYDPNNPFAGMGAALQTTIGSAVLREDKKTKRLQDLEDTASLSQQRKELEQRAEETRIRAEERANADQIADEDRAERFADKQRAKDIEAKAAEEERQKARFKAMQVENISTGLKSSSESKTAADRARREVTQNFFRQFGGGMLAHSGRSPIDVDKELDFEIEQLRGGKRRGTDYSTLKDRPARKTIKAFDWSNEENKWFMYDKEI